MIVSNIYFIKKKRKIEIHIRPSNYGLDCRNLNTTNMLIIVYVFGIKLIYFLNQLSNSHLVFSTPINCLRVQE